ncbi:MULTISPECIES: sulfite oxidase-like oxidoreductase [Microbacterium]|jgi:DMSO/TMAO reductase YedYZ molybdopterin-dependent catalytic subunit|uniref:sulfite oxidase-like oxidoreductase n=1 Tax=Microbacterium TaxID=33882 RepID=UPI0010F8BC25|nr:sulfite oxidase-like oxidoreductase [Microbacterium sp. 4NA327F11]MCK9919884.1 sulfite oxidase-like oxidoreductase [Microbacteriaceae bacterium K1510]
MANITRGFTGRRRAPDPAVPPGQYLTDDFPVLSAGPTPRVDLDEWRFSVRTEKGFTTTWTWSDFLALPQEEVHTDIHCVTRWSKLGTSWRGVSLDTIMAAVDSDFAYAMVHCYGGYTTNVPMADLLGGQAWIAHEFDGRALEPVHGGPARLLVPHLYFWKSAKWVRGLVMQKKDAPGFWEQNGYHRHGDPWREERYA